MTNDALFRPLIETARDLRDKRMTAQELIEAAIARHERFGEKLHAYSHWAPEQARAAAAAADPWERDGPLVATLRRQLGVIMGKTHMVEFAFGGTGHNSHWGAPYNPWDAAAHRSVGGSSSGAGVSLLEGSASLAFGSDTAGSVRIPASMTGTVGLKVTLGRWSTDGVVPLSPTFDTPGLLARSVADVAYGFAALDPAGKDPEHILARAVHIAGVRIGVGDPFLWRDCDPGIAEAAEEAVRALGRAGAETLEFVLPEAEAAYAVFMQGSLSAVELRSFLDLELPGWLAQFDPVIAPAVRNAENINARDYFGRLARLRALARTAAPRLDAIDVIASPTLCVTPPLMSDVAEPEGNLRVNRRIVRNTVAVNYLGLCAITLPVGLDRAGMPVGLQLIAPAGAEEKLLAIALAAERVLGTASDRLGAPLLLRAA